MTPADISELSHCSSVLNPAGYAILVTSWTPQLEHRWDQEIVFCPHLSGQTFGLIQPAVQSVPWISSGG